jgi:hypothetical protein
MNGDQQMNRNELKARMTALYGFDAEAAAWIAETVRRMPLVEVEQELQALRGQ